MREFSNELRSILEVLTPRRLDFLVSGDDVKSAKRGVGVNGAALRLHAKPPEALHSGADAIVGDDTTRCRHLTFYYINDISKIFPRHHSRNVTYNLTRHCHRTSMLVVSKGPSNFPA